MKPKPIPMDQPREHKSWHGDKPKERHHDWPKGHNDKPDWKHHEERGHDWKPHWDKDRHDWKPKGRDNVPRPKTNPKDLK